jgi:glycosyltransferase involved in cell wall biosynthesis
VSGWGAGPERLVLVQYAGDFREAFERLASGGEEYYHAQRYSVDLVSRLSRPGRDVVTVCWLTDERYDVELRPGLRAIGVGGSRSSRSRRPLVRVLKRMRPTHVVVRTLVPELLEWVSRARVRAIATVAEALPADARRCVQLLNKPFFEWVGCYSPSSAERFAEAGVERRKLIAWGWPPECAPQQLPAKAAPSGGPMDLLYVGAVREEKGVSDLLNAVSQLRAGGLDVRLSLVGPGEADLFRARAAQLGLDEAVRFLGPIPSASVLSAMRAADAVVIPSRASYPEALPLVLDHSLCARTPAVVSAHPSFADRLEHRRDAMLFTPGNVEGLASAIAELLKDAALYARISARAPEVWTALQAPVVWGQLIEAWLQGTLA